MYSRTIYVNVDSPNLGFPYFNFLGEARVKQARKALQIWNYESLHWLTDSVLYLTPPEDIQLHPNSSHKLI